MKMTCPVNPDCSVEDFDVFKMLLHVKKRHRGWKGPMDEKALLKLVRNNKVEFKDGLFQSTHITRLPWRHLVDSTNGTTRYYKGVLDSTGDDDEVTSTTHTEPDRDEEGCVTFSDIRKRWEDVRSQRSIIILVRGIAGPDKSQLAQYMKVRYAN